MLALLGRKGADEEVIIEGVNGGESLWKVKVKKKCVGYFSLNVFSPPNLTG